MFKLWNAIDKLVRSVKVMVAWMAKALVPEHMFGSSFDGIDRRLLLFESNP